MGCGWLGLPCTYHIVTTIHTCCLLMMKYLQSTLCVIVMPISNPCFITYDDGTSNRYRAWMRNNINIALSNYPLLRQLQRWFKRPFARYSRHLVGVRCRGSINCMHAGTPDSAYVEIHTVKYIFVWMKRYIPILNKYLPNKFKIKAASNLQTYFAQYSDDTF